MWLNRTFLNKPILIIAKLILVGTGIYCSEPYMIPYKNTMVIMTHGINSDRYTWLEKDAEGNINKNSKKNCQSCS